MPQTHRTPINRANAERQALHFWNADRVAILKLLWKAGRFSSDIANAIGDGCTQAMVVSKANRLKLTNRKDFVRFGAKAKSQLIRVARETKRVTA